MAEPSVTPELEIAYLDIDSILPNPFQPRQIFEEEELEALANSIREVGILQPILVRPGAMTETGAPGWFLIAGERRWRASARVGMWKIPAIVRETTPLEGGILAAVENLQRRDMSVQEEADMVLTLLTAADNNGTPMTIADLGKKLGKGRGKRWVENRIAFLAFDEDIRRMIGKRAETLTHGSEIDKIKHEGMRGLLIDYTINGAALKPIHALCSFILKAKGKTDEEEIQDFIDLYERNNSSLPALEQKIERRLAQLHSTEQAQHAPDAQTEVRANQNAANGGGNVSRGQMVTGTSPRLARKELMQALNETKRQLLNAVAWSREFTDFPADARKEASEIRHLLEQLPSHGDP